MVGFAQIDIEDLALADAVHAVKTQRTQRPLDGFALWIQNAVFRVT